MLSAYSFDSYTFFWGTLYLVVIFGSVFLLKNLYNLKYPIENKSFLLPCLAIKIIGGIIFAYQYAFYSNYEGDTLYYFDLGLSLANKFSYNSANYFAWLFDSMPHHRQSFVLAWNHKTIESVHVTLFAMARFGSLFILLAQKNYFITTILVSTFSFYGSWLLYRFFKLIFPKLNTIYLVFIFLTPSTFYFTSGLLKDTFSFAAMGIILFHVYSIVEFKKYSYLSFFLIIASTYIMISIKPYLFFGLCYAFSIWLFIKISKTLTFLRYRSFFIITLILFYISVNFLITKMLSTSLSDQAVTVDSTIVRIYFLSNNFPLLPNAHATFQTFILTIISYFFQLHLSLFKGPINVFYLIFWFENILIYVLLFQIIFINSFSLIYTFKEKPILISLLLFSLILYILTFICTASLGNAIRLRTPAISTLLCTLAIIKHMQIDRLTANKLEQFV